MTTADSAQKLQTDSYFGREAAEIIGNPALVQAFELLRKKITDQWIGSNVRDPAEGVLLLQQMKAVDWVQVNLATLIAAGTMADADIQRQREKAAAEIQRIEQEADGLIARGMRQVRALRDR